MSARARFLVFLLWAVKMEDLEDLEGRVRPEVGAAEGWESSEESWEVKANVVEEDISLDLVLLGRGRP